MDGSDEHDVELSGPIKFQLSRVLHCQGFYPMDLVITHYMNVKKCYYSVLTLVGLSFVMKDKFNYLFLMLVLYTDKRNINDEKSFVAVVSCLQETAAYTDRFVL
jgi:hypothetical protein